MKSNKINKMTITDKEKKYITDLILDKDLTSLKLFFKDNEFELEDLKSNDFNLLVYVIQQNISVKAFKIIIEECQFDNFNYSTSKHNSPLYYAIFHEQFKIADILLERKANINFLSENNSENIFYHLYNNSNLSLKKLNYLLKNGAVYTTDIIEKFIKRNDNLYFRVILKYTFTYQRFILKLLDFSHQHQSVSTTDLNNMIDNEFNVISFTKSLYQSAINNDNYEAIKLLYDNDTRNRSIILGNIFEIYDREDRETRSDKKFNFINLIESGIININIDKYFLNNLENIDEKRAILSEIILCNNFTEFKQFIRDHQFHIPYFNTERMDMAIIAIENNVSLPMFDYICRHYLNLNFNINDIYIYRSPLSTALAQNKFQMADILIRYGVDICYKIDNMDIYQYLNEYQILNPQNLKYLLKKCPYIKDITTKYINELFNKNNFQYLNIIFKYYTLNETCILRFLHFYRNKIPVSRNEFNDMIEKEKEKINYNLKFYEDAVAKENYHLLDILYNNDTRTKQTILNDIFISFEKDQQHNEDSKKKETFIKMVQNKEICLNIDEFFLDNLINIEKKKEKINELTKRKQFYELKFYLQENHIFQGYFEKVEDDLLIKGIEHNAPVDYIYFLITYIYEYVNYTKDHISPLYAALSNNNFRIADLLLEKGAEINVKLNDKDIIYFMQLKNKLNSQNLYYILNHGINLTDNNLKSYINYIPFPHLKSIFMYYIYQGNESVIPLIYYSLNKVKLNNDQINRLLKVKYDLEFNYEFYEKSLYNNSSKTLLFFINHDGRKLTTILDKYSNDLFKVGIIDGNTKLIDKILSCPNYNYYKNLDFERIISRERTVNHKRNIRTLKYFIKELLQLDSFDLEKVNLSKLIVAIQNFNSKDTLKYVINKISCHSSFTFDNISLNNVISSLLIIKPEYLNFQKKFIKKCIRKKIINLNFNENENKFITYLNILFTCYYNEKSFKQLFDEIWDHSNINFSKNVDFLVCFETIHTISNDKNVAYDMVEYFIKKACTHKTFNFEKIPIHEFITIFIDYNANLLFHKRDTYNRLIHITDIFYSHEKFKFVYNDFKKALNVLYNTLELEFIEYFIDKNLSLPDFKIDIDNWVNDLEQSLEEHNDTFQYVLEKYLDNENFDFNNVPYEKFIKRFNWKDIYILDTLIINKRIIQSDSLITKLFQLFIQYNKISFLRTLFNEHLDHDFSRINIFLEKILLETIQQNHHIDMVKYIFNELLNYDVNYDHVHFTFNDFNLLEVKKETTLINENPSSKLQIINIKKLLLESNKCDCKESIQFLLEFIFGISIQQKITYLADPLFKQCDTPDRILLLNSAIRLNNLWLVKCFFENEDFTPTSTMNLNDMDENGDSPLNLAFNAIKHDKTFDIFEYLLSHHTVNTNNYVNVNNNKLQQQQQQQQQQPFLVQALCHNNYHLVHFILKKEEVLRDMMINGNNNEYSMYMNNKLQNVQSYLSFIKKFNTSGPFGFTPLIYIYLMKSETNNKVFEELVSKLQNNVIDAVDAHGYSLLHYAIFKNDVKMVKYLIGREAEVNYQKMKENYNNKNKKMIYRHSALDIVVCLGHEEILLALLKKKNISVKEVNQDNEIPLITLLKYNQDSLQHKMILMEHLFNKGSPANTKDKNGKYALFFAIEAKCLPMVKLLLKYQASIHERIKENNESILEYSVRVNYIPIIEYFITHPSFEKYYSKSKLIKLMIYQYHLEQLKILFTHYPSLINNKDELGCSPIIYAIKSRNTDIINYMKEYHLITNDDIDNIFNHHHNNNTYLNDNLHMLKNIMETINKFK
ncbi:hypothetical protein PIROE2DRAFT_62551 [Piromyces sp. E2]|nr:hypothetical protein PIROE2DRAFT_62551 [Piromyces sp. E2]|eukprot:OUM61380.1 hypothetical protein PIROE2DRAFT_62551 [Piromyces sp. E2]